MNIIFIILSFTGTWLYRRKSAKQYPNKTTVTQDTVKPAYTTTSITLQDHHSSKTTNAKSTQTSSHIIVTV